ncbi:MAG: extensin family protein [Methylocystis sp.]|uniref:extensin-like domain-containing protein n=1 Tax=Methylocystis sp. TaxID=1911079 RepID=UPI003D0DC184
MSVIATFATAIDAPTPPRRPDFQKAAPDAKPPAVETSPQAHAPPQSDCMTDLQGAGVVFDKADAPPGGHGGCALDAPVRLSAITVDKRRIALNAKPLLSCAFALRFSDFVKNLLAPLGSSALNAPIAAIDTGPGYQCRSRNHRAEAKLSAHAKGMAIDVSGFVLSDGRKIAVDAQPDSQSTAYVKSLRTAACGWFTTVLGPGSDPYHATHLHFDIERHGSSDAYRICQ